MLHRMVNSVEYGFAETPFGECFIASCDEGVCDVQFTDGNKEQLVGDLSQRYAGGQVLHNSAMAQRVALAMLRCPSDCDSLRVCLIGTPFQVKVWTALRGIPFGATTTYSDLASKIGKASAVRAVASAVARNPVSYILPCHRVIRKSGVIGEYRWGHDRKVAILNWEERTSES